MAREESQHPPGAIRLVFTSLQMAEPRPHLPKDCRGTSGGRILQDPCHRGIGTNGIWKEVDKSLAIKGSRKEDRV